MTQNVVVIGNPSDPTFTYFIAKCAGYGLRPTVLNLCDIADEGSWDLAVPEDGTSTVGLRGRTQHIGNVSAVYCRWRTAPTSGDDDIEARRRLLTMSLKYWTLTCEAKVVNRVDSASHNGSKSLHEHFLSGLGFRVPPSISSCNSNDLLGFCAEYGPSVVKATSGRLAHCRLFKPTDLVQQKSSETGPIHLQQYVAGSDVRVHVLEDDVIATLIQSSGSSVDYRSTAAGATYHDYKLSPEMEMRLREATALQRLSFCGWDFKLDAKQQLWCLEANPMPGYSFYDQHLGGRITDALVRLLWNKAR